MCLVSAGTSTPTPVSPPANNQGQCLDYANNPGYWVVVTEANKTLPIPAQQGTVWGSLPMTATNVVDENNLVRTLRFWACDVLGDTHDGEAQVYWTDCENFPPFTVVYAPIQMVQLKVAPFAILYAPPGDASTATFKITNTYKAAVTLGSGTKMSDSGTSQAGYAANFSLNAGTKLYADATLNLGESWDTGTITGYGNGINNTNVSTGTQVSSISYLTVADYSLIPEQARPAALSPIAASWFRPRRPWSRLSSTTSSS